MKWNIRNVEGSSYGLIRGTLSKFIYRDGGKITKNLFSDSRSPDQYPNRALPNTNQQRQALDRDNTE